jgi:hypothetical protein
LDQIHIFLEINLLHQVLKLVEVRSLLGAGIVTGLVRERGKLTRGKLIKTRNLGNHLIIGSRFNNPSLGVGDYYPPAKVLSK